jgi:hypothetical protein
LENGETVEATTEHPFYVVGQGWKNAEVLTPGHMLTLRNGKNIKLVNVTYQAQKVIVYNLTVAEAHTFYIGRDGLLVHNGKKKKSKVCEERFAEAALYGSKKHGLKWKEGPARAKNDNKDQGQFGSRADIEWVVLKSYELEPGTDDFFDLPPIHSSFVHLAEGGTAPATKVFIKVYPSGKVHAYPVR